MSSFVYIMTNKKNGTLYVGVTKDLTHRIHQHKTKELDGFTAKYGLDRLVYYEVHNDLDNAIQREKRIKDWKRDWKIKLIQDMNPDWSDLYESLNA